MNSVSAPTPPDPNATAAAQTGMNRDTALSTQLTNMTNQVTPSGSLNYNQTGNNTYVDSTGKTVSIPQFTATQSLSPTEQGIFNTGETTKQNLANIGADQSAKIGGILGTNVDLSNDAVEGRLMDLGSKRLDPMFARSDDALRTRLSNQGIEPGSQAWNAEMTQAGQTKNDAYNQLLLTGHQQGVSDIMAQRNAPINEISALMSGSQVSQPNFTNTPQTQVAGVDYGGMVNNQYQGQVQQQQIAQSGQNALMGGLFGLAGSAATAGIKYSDRRLKTEIRTVGKLHNGLPVHSFRMKTGGPKQIGLMADEVQKVRPEAVSEDARGMKMVDYEKATA